MRHAVLATRSAGSARERSIDLSRCSMAWALLVFLALGPAGLLGQGLLGQGLFGAESHAGGDHPACDASWDSRSDRHDAHDDERFESASTEAHEHLAAASTGSGADRTASNGSFGPLATARTLATDSHATLGAAAADAVRPRGPPRA